MFTSVKVHALFLYPCSVEMNLYHSNGVVRLQVRGFAYTFFRKEGLL